MHRVWLWLPVVANMAVIYHLSGQPVLPGVSLLPDWLNHDWLHHGVAYGGLALLTLRAVAGARWDRVGPPALATAWLMTVGYGVSDEWHQSFVPGRSAEVRDVVSDGVGAAVALAGAWAWGIIRRSS